MTEVMQEQSDRLVYITVNGPPLVIIPGLMQEEGPQITGGYAKWEDITRRERKSLTDWTGTDPYRMSLPLRLDGWRTNEMIEPNINAIENLARPESGLGEVKPPVFRVRIPGQVPRGYNAWLWVAETITWGPYIKRDSDGKRLRQDVTIDCLEFVDPDVIVIRKYYKGKNKVWRYKTKKGDTMKKIAANQLHNGNRWPEIKRMNDKYRDPNRVFKTGTSLKLPPSSP
jgi:hypothetical protein